MSKYFVTMLLLVLSFYVYGQQKTELILQPGEKVWAGVVSDGELMPFSKDYSMDFYGNNKSNQIQPLLLTSKGQYVWSEDPFKFEVTSNKVTISNARSKVETGTYGKTLAEVQRFVSNKYFKASGLMPDSLLFTSPQYNTWIELGYRQNQVDVLKYARAIVDNGMPVGVIMIDGTWQEDEGLWNFHPGRFSNPKEMVDQLHAMGFKVMLWVSPFVSPDQKLLYFDLKNKKALMMEKANATDTYATAKDPIMVRWWSGVSAELDFSSPSAVKWFNDELDKLVKTYNVDGFKLDAGDTRFYTPKSLSKGNVSPNVQAELYAKIGLRFPLNEYRACWKMGGQPLVQRLQDKAHSWADLQVLIPQIIVQGLSGYTFCCPDLIGGGDIDSFDKNKIIQDLVVRSAQCHALSPMMQFSVAPWRVLDSVHLDAVKKAVKTRSKYIPVIMKLAKESAKTGEPIVKNLEFVFPNQGYESIIDQFMLGDKILVAPMLESGSKRNVVLPKGKWLADDGTTYKGGKTYEINVPIDRLPYFQKVK